MKTWIPLVLCLAGCASLPTPPPIPRDPELTNLGLLMLLNSGYSTVPLTTTDVVVRSELQNLGVLPVTPPVVVPLREPISLTCIEQKKNPVYGTTGIVCQ